MRPDRPPVPDDPARLAGFRNLYLQTGIGVLDFLDEISGVGDYTSVLKESEIRDIQGFSCRVLTLDGLIRAKRAAGRQKDKRAVVELEAIRRRIEEQKSQ